MSDAAKNRVLVLGAQFNSVEQSTGDAPQSKKSFWKRNTNKVPGRYGIQSCVIVVQAIIFQTLSSHYGYQLTKLINWSCSS